MIFVGIVLLLNVLGGLAAPTVDLEYNPMENPDLFEGDIETDGDEDERSAITSKQMLWPHGVIPYVIDSGLQQTVKSDIVYKAIAAYNNQSCLTFVHRTTEKDYIRFVTGVGCSTRVGRRGGEHRITLGAGCGLVGSVMHEIGHAIGFYHEHNRSDRHKHIKVLWDNIKEGKDSQFKQRAPGTDLLLTPFDFDSLMLYGDSFFSKEPGKLKTMVSLNNQKFPEVRYRTKLTSVDLKRIKLLYSC